MVCTAPFICLLFAVPLLPLLADISGARLHFLLWTFLTLLMCTSVPNYLPRKQKD